jgi:hypothetical protein
MLLALLAPGVLMGGSPSDAVATFPSLPLLGVGQ